MRVKDHQLAPEAMSGDALLEDLGIDSFGSAEMLFNIEDVFNLVLPSEPVDLPTLGDVVDYIDKLAALQTARPQASAVGVRGRTDPAQGPAYAHSTA